MPWEYSIPELDEAYNILRSKGDKYRYFSFFSENERFMSFSICYPYFSWGSSEDSLIYISVVIYYIFKKDPRFSISFFEL